MRLFNRVTIVGLGLIGGSLGMAIRRKQLARVTGWSRKASTLRQAKARGAIDEGFTNLRAAVADADLIVLATPIDAMAPLAIQAARWANPGTILTDVGSTKGHIVALLERRLPKPVHFVGAHPIAGSEQRGLAAADATVFHDAVTVLTPTRRTDQASLRRVAALWTGVGSRVIRMSPQAHDVALAGTSHLAHIVASCLVQVGRGSSAATAPPSFLEMTRIVKSDPDLWDDIFVTNRRALLAAMARFERSWRSLRARIARGDRIGLRRLLTRSKTFRDALK